MKNLFLVATLMFGMVAMGQTEKQNTRRMENSEKISPEKQIDKRLAKMTETLNLTASQQKDVRKLMEETQKANLIKREERKKIQEQRKMEMQNQRKMYDSKMSSILNVEQKAKWEKMQADKKENVKPKMEKRQRKNLRREKK